MKLNRFLMLALAGISFFTSCEGEDDLPETPEVEEGQYANGIFVLNEGNFGQGNSTISFIDEDLQNISHNIFRKENTGTGLGDTGQSMGFSQDYAWIVVNVSNKIEVVDRNTFERIATIDEGLENPRYIAFSGGNAFVTNWGDGSDPNDDYVAVINTNTLNIADNIPVAEGPEKIIYEDRNIYVAHKGGWSFNNKISVINATNFVVEEVEVGDLPNSLDIEDGYLWVSSSGLPDYSGNETAGKIQKMDLETLEVVEEYNFEEASNHPAFLHVDNGMVYYTLGGNAYKFGTGASSLPTEPFLGLSEVESLYGFDVEDGIIYAASANSSNTGDGDLYIYDAATGALITSFETGINPNGVFFN